MKIEPILISELSLLIASKLLVGIARFGQKKETFMEKSFTTYQYKRFLLLDKYLVLFYRKKLLLTQTFVFICDIERYIEMKGIYYKIKLLKGFL